MGKMDGQEQSVGAAEVPASMAAAPVLLITEGRGGLGKSTLSQLLLWRAMHAGRPVIAADADMRTKTLSALFPSALRPASEELPDVKQYFNTVLNRMVRERASVVLDIGAGDNILKEYGRDLRLVEFCQRRGIQAVAVYVLGPSEDDLTHILSLWKSEHFRPKRSIVVLNAGVVPRGQTVLGAFDQTLSNKEFRDVLKAMGAPYMVVPPLGMLTTQDRKMSPEAPTFREMLKQSPTGFYGLAYGTAPVQLDPVEEFMVQDWLEDLEAKFEEKGVTDWLP